MLRASAVCSVILFAAGMLPWSAAHGQEPSISPASQATEVDAVEPTTTFDPEIPLDQLEILVKPLMVEELVVEAEAWTELLHRKARQISAMRLGVKKTNEALSTEDEAVATAAIEAAEAVKQKADSEAEESEQELTAAAQTRLGLEAASDEPDEQVDTPADKQSVESQSASSVEASSAEATTPAVAEVASAKKDELLGSVNELQDQRAALADRLEVVLTSLELKGGDVEKYRRYKTAVSGIDIDTSDASATWSVIKGWVAAKEGGQRWVWNVTLFLAILAATLVLAKAISLIVNWLLERRLRLSQLAERLISRTVSNVILVIGFAVALTALEIDITPIIAAIGAAGFIIGFALQLHFRGLAV